jgi:hypothetical protein
MAVHTQMDSLIESIKRLHEAQFDVLADTRSMNVNVVSERPAGDHDADWERKVELHVDQREGLLSLDMNDFMLGQMSTDLKIPKTYFDRMKLDAPGLFQTNVHHWLHNTPKRKLIRARHDGSIGEPVEVGRAWLSDRYRRLDNIEVAYKLLPELNNIGSQWEIHNASISDTKFHFRATFPSMEKAVKVGDPVRWGVQITNSEVGGAQFSIDNFTLTLACMNGMVVSKVMSARHVGKRLGDNLSDEAIRADDKAFWLAARDELRASISEERFEEVIATLRGATEGSRIVAPIKATETLAKTFDLTDGEKEAVLLSLVGGADMTRYGALNAVTDAAKRSESFDRRVEMEEIGWKVAELTPREWDRIAVAA